MTSFDTCLAFTWRPENDGQPMHTTAGDRGGATSWGVTIGTYTAWRRGHGRPVPTVADLQAAPKSELAQLYAEEFWNPISAARLPVGVDLMTFDFGVTSGVGTSARLLQETLQVTVDGRIGPGTLAAALSADRITLIRNLAARHEQYYRSLTDFPRFGRGWLRRNADRLTAALASQPADTTTPANTNLAAAGTAKSGILGELRDAISSI
ncbi:lysozyme family protein [Endobacter medicaginis]|uniref:Lysozyme family protein n=1 Tax=Endobacter medicaginis TaxID=1181271 RepID=A0A839V7Q4_9PROT|nr:glycosyl hydrolase 108 family protein [Endobacter medicaginis]MBB3175451.1 lysozyme family protein [Endobacter medicaginis]MCX5477114.1 hypothetical protein [Endobacter medicaginis]NVN29829.1 hypothetical protein [Endobacter medicaginis]